MAVGIIETQTGALAANATVSPVIATTLLATDRVVVEFAKSGTGGTPTATAPGAWTNHVAGATTRDNYIYSTTGVTGAGVTPTFAIGTSSGDWVMHVLRSDLGNQVEYFDGATAVSSPAANTPTGPADSFAIAGMCVVGAGWVLSGTLTFPSSPAPASGWTTVHTGANSGFKFVSNEIAANGPLSLKASSSAAGQSHVVNRAVFLDRDTVLLRSVAVSVVVDDTPLPTSTKWKGWGVPR